MTQHGDRVATRTVTPTIDGARERVVTHRADIDAEWSRGGAWLTSFVLPPTAAADAVSSAAGQMDLPSRPSQTDGAMSGDGFSSALAWIGCRAAAHAQGGLRVMRRQAYGNRCDPGEDGDDRQQECGVAPRQ